MTDSFRVAVDAAWLRTTAKKQKRQARASKLDPAALRRRMEKAVEQLIAALDALDGEAEDLELGGDEEDCGDEEPSIGALELMHGGNQETWTAGANDDREDEHDGAESCEEGEPSLGSFDRMMD